MKCRRFIFATLIMALAASSLFCQIPVVGASSAGYKGGRITGCEVSGGDTMLFVTINPVYVFPRPKDMRQYQRLVNNVKKVYPIARQARAYLDTLEQQLSKVTTTKERDRITKAMEKTIKKRYTPILEKMTFSQGKILIKLIDRQTDKTSYQLLRDFRGGLSASFWNTIARIFKANLKQGYDKENNQEDQLIEEIIMQYEAGLI